MKKIHYVLIASIVLFFSANLSSQTATSLEINDTRDVNEPPSYFGTKEIRADLKFLTSAGISTAYGFTTNLTISPGFNGTAGYIHQMSFNNNGLFYRNGDFSSSWNGWRKLLVSDPNGDYQIGNDAGEYVGYGRKLNFGLSNDNTDDIHFVRNNISPDVTELVLNIGDDSNDKLVIGRRFWGEEAFTPQFVFKTNGYMGIGISEPTVALDVNGTISSQNLLTSGSIGIGTVNTTGYKLAVDGIIRAKEIRVDSDWADFVFKKDYRLPTLKDVETHINENGTLPGVPSEQEVKTNGTNLAETNVLLLQKIEELTLYIIQQDKRIETLESKMLQCTDR